MGIEFSNRICVLFETLFYLDGKPSSSEELLVGNNIKG